MLQSMGWQRVGQDLATEQQQDVKEKQQGIKQNGIGTMKKGSAAWLARNSDDKKNEKKYLG